jgi:hypothetical protein
MRVDQTPAAEIVASAVAGSVTGTWAGTLADHYHPVVLS